MADGNGLNRRDDCACHGSRRPQAGFPPSGSYLNGASIGDPVAKAPDTTSETALLDLYLTRLAQREAPVAAKNQAFDDAAAYFLHDILPRFSQAAGSEEPLTPSNKPILAHMLS